jgi:hypothetical protein
LKPDTPVSLVARALAAYFDQPYGIASDDAVRDSGIERYLSTARDLQEWYAQLARCEPAMLNALRS